MKQLQYRSPRFTSHTPDVALILYSYHPKMAGLYSDLMLRHSGCQGILLDCIPIKTTVFPGFCMKNMINIEYSKSDKLIADKISRLESGTTRAQGECFNYLIPYFEDMSNYIIHYNDLYIRDATFVWCRSPPDYGRRLSGRGLENVTTDSFFNINLYHSTKCIRVQAYPIIKTQRHKATKTTDCAFDLIFIDIEHRFKRNQFRVNSLRDAKVCYNNNSQFRSNEVTNERITWEGRGSRVIKFWSTSIDLSLCGYFNIYLDTTEQTQMFLPLTHSKHWLEWPIFKRPLQGSDLFLNLVHNIEISNYETRSPIIAHYDPSQYIANVLNKVPSIVHTLPHYATRITLKLLPSSQCRELFIKMEIIIRSTSDMYPYLYHHYTVELKLTLLESFTFTEYLFMERRFIRILPKSVLTCNGHVQLIVNPLHPLPQINIKPFTVRGILLERNKELSVDYNYIILLDDFHLSWNAAKEKCVRLGGRLPMINTEDKVQMLTRLLLGDTFRNSTKNRFIRTPCRQNHGPLCGTYVGLYRTHDRVGIHMF